MVKIDFRRNLFIYFGILHLRMHDIVNENIKSTLSK